MPLVIREAISWQLPILIYNLPVYLNYFDKFNNIQYKEIVDAIVISADILNNSTKTAVSGKPHKTIIRPDIVAHIIDKYNTQPRILRKFSILLFYFLVGIRIIAPPSLTNSQL